jgi:RIO-like serine/threonine protein kinase
VPAALLRGEVHLILANPPWRQLQERAQKILGDKKHAERMLSRRYCVVQFNTAHKLHRFGCQVPVSLGTRHVVLAGL